ncbi:di-N-acetylchitobiase-like isoform X1 [Corticium candelabrum]|uniref:di-N-acetylchitobiase-like isoform X1 n=2 Tax=Corticium candelabrum TaxID=121492 RepID=UPI002E2762B5|nr:di-N-acetylchitobiase-like isoform X1 [Corticium candelabrum]
MLLLVFFTFLSYASASCPCSDESHCQPIASPPKQEIFAFSTEPNNWRQYDWSKVTTVALFRNPNDPELMCYAHSKGARVVLRGLFSVAKLTNKTERDLWLKTQVEMAKEYHMDGINIDIEDPISDSDSALRDDLTQLVFDTKVAFAGAIPGSQVSFDIAWSPDCADGRCYDTVGLANVVDFLVVMSYDERSQIRGACIASANSPLPQTVEGIEMFRKYGIPDSKLVLGQPWYGYNYPCISMSDGNICHLEEVPFRGVNCSDAAGSEENYSDIQKLLINSTSGRIWNATLCAPFFDYVASDGRRHQVWYDDPQSIGMKCDYVVANGLRGIAMWTSDSLDYSNTPDARAQTKAMWDALPTW